MLLWKPIQFAIKGKKSRKATIFYQIIQCKLHNRLQMVGIFRSFWPYFIIANNVFVENPIGQRSPCYGIKVCTSDLAFYLLRAIFMNIFIIF